MADVGKIIKRSTIGVVIMIKKRLILVCSLAVLLIGGGVIFHLNSNDFSINNMFQSPRDKQLEYLKKHEEEIVKYIKKRFPNIESVQIDWSTFNIGPISNGIAITGYNLSIKGKFNNLDNTKFSIDFYLNREHDMPDIDKIGMLHHPKILKNDVWWTYE